MSKITHFLLIVTIMAALIFTVHQSELVLANSSNLLAVCEGDLPAAECQALIELYNATDGDHWTNNEGWVGPDNPCSWFGIGCNADGDHVTAVYLIEK